MINFIHNKIPRIDFNIIVSITPCCIDTELSFAPALTIKQQFEKKFAYASIAV